MPLFIGHEGQLALLAAAFGDARAASPRTVLVEGAAGIGKTMLLRHFLSGLADTQVLPSSGEEVEAALPYGVLNQIRAEAGARPVGDVADPLAAGAEFLKLLGDLQETAPVVVTVDDAHWSDTPSLHALVFALRRLRVDRVLAVLVVRGEEAWRLPGSVERLVAGERGGRTLLSGLTGPQLIELSEALGTGKLTRTAARRLHEHTGGNPLYATALLKELGAEGLAHSGTGPLPAPQSYAATVRARVSSCSSEAQRLVTAGAVLGVRWPLDVGARLAEISDPLAALEEAIRASILAEAQSGAMRFVRFSHPLTAAAIYHSMGPARRSALHSQAAEIVGDRAMVLRHRAAAAPAADSGLVAELKAFAQSQADLARWAAAADATLSASRLTPKKREREELLVDTFEFLVAAGDFNEALALADEIENFDESAGRSFVLALKSAMTGQLAEIDVLLADAWRRCDPTHEKVLAARIASTSCMSSINAGYGKDAVMWSKRTLDLDPEGASNRWLLPRLLFCLATAAVGHHEEGLRLTSTLPDPLPDPRPDQVGELMGRGILRLWTQDLVGARKDLDSVVRACRRRGPLTLAINSLFYLADTEYRLGQWDDAAIHAELAVSTTEDAEWALGFPFADSVAAFVPAARGEHDRALRHSQRAAAFAIDAAQRLWAAVAGARVAQAAGDRVAQVAACEGILDLAGRDTVEQPIVQPWRELYAEALVYLDQLDEAEEVLERLESWLNQHETACGRWGALRIRGLLAAARGEPVTAHRAFDAALSACAGVPIPFEKAGIQLDYGAFLRRQGRRRAALDQLLAAHSVLEKLGARSFLARCEDEVAACGVSVASSGRAVAHLTPQEKWVARLAATGMTNRDIAAELMLSIKTIEYHLGNIFAKLGVRSRVEMAARLDAGPLGARRDH